MKLFYVAVVTLLIVLFFVLFYLNSGDIDHQITEEQRRLIFVASKKAKELGFEPNAMEMAFDFNNTKWYKNRNPEDPNFNDIDFQVIYYGPKEKILGGNLTIVVDKQKMEVIWFRRGQ